MISLRDTIAAAIVSLVVGAGIGGVAVNETKDTTPTPMAAQAPADSLNAVQVCQNANTQVSLVTDSITSQAKHFAAKLDVPDEARYDLTWQQGGTVIAVEKLKDGKTTPWTEQIDQKFNDCLATKVIVERDVHSD